MGARVPHVPLTDNGGRISTLDAAEHGFAVLADDGHELWRQAADEAEQSLGVAIAVKPVDPGSLPGPSEAPADAAGSGWTGAALIRPDGVIAWKPHAPAAEAAGQLTAVMAGLLSRPGT